MNRENVVNCLFNAIVEFNAERPSGRHLEKAEETELFGRSSQLDSLELVNFIVTAEEMIDDEFDKSLSLADEKAMSRKNSPFKTVGSLVDYTLELLEDQ